MELPMKFYRDAGRQPLSRIASTCKFFSFLCRLVFVAMIAWSIFALGLMCLSLASSNFPDDVLPFALAVPFLYALYSANSCLLPLTLDKILADISQERTPFTIQNSNRLAFLAIVLLLYVVFETLLVTVDSQFVLSLGEYSVEVGNLVRSFSTDSGTTLNLFPLLMAAMFFALSYVFKYGVLLQQESDETL